jgi:hypothetical protein
VRAKIAACAALVAALCAAATPEALAEEKTCRGTIKGKTLDNVRVPQGEQCTLRGTKVKGTITVNDNARLEAINVSVIGNVQAENARNVIIRKTSKVDGSVQIVQGKRARVRNSKVGSDILYDEQSGEVAVRGTTVGGNVQAFQNNGGVIVRGTVIDGNLQCKGNHPAPKGGNNQVDGSKEDQCSSL